MIKIFPGDDPNSQNCSALVSSNPSKITSLADEVFENKLKHFQEDDSSDYEIEFTPLSFHFSEIPSDSPFADTDLILMDDVDYRLMPVNGIKKTEFKETEELFKQIQNGTAKLQIDPTDQEFFDLVAQDIKILLTRKIGRKLITKICQKTQSTTVTKSVEVKTAIGAFVGVKTSASYHPTEGKVVHNPHEQLLLIGINPSGQRQFYTLPSYLLLGHELIHASDRETLGPKYYLPPTLEKEYHNLEEQVVITGLSDDVSFPPQCEGWEPWIQNDYQELNERNLTAAFSGQSLNFYPRVGHNGTKQNPSHQAIDDYRVTTHPLIQEKVLSLESELAKMHDLPAPPSFIIDCYFWFNTLKDQGASSKTLEALLTSLKLVKAENSQKLDSAIIAYKNLKQWGDWKQEAIDELFSNLLKDCRQSILESVLQTVHEKLFQPYINDFKNSSLLLPKDRESIEKELWNYLIQEKNPISKQGEEDIEESHHLKLEECESLLRLLFIKKIEHEETTSFILKLVKNTSYYANPQSQPMEFLRTLGKNNHFTEPHPTLQNRLAKFFEPALAEVLKNFLVQQIPEHEMFFLNLFEELLSQPSLVMQEFQVKQRSYAQILLSYLEAHPEKIPTNRKELVSQLIEMLKS